jgi:uncharacterized protein YdaT
MFAFGNKHPYDEVSIGCKINSSKSIAIAVHDQRAYVLDSGKTPDYCGNMRSGVGIPYDIHTKSGVAVASEMLTIICNAMIKNGTSVQKVVTTHAQKTDQVIENLKNTHADKLVYIKILEWKTDTYMKADLYCLMNLFVYNQQGDLIVETTVKASREAYGGSFWNPKKAARKGALKALKLKLEALVNDDTIVKALS